MSVSVSDNENTCPWGRIDKLAETVRERAKTLDALEGNIISRANMERIINHYKGKLVEDDKNEGMRYESLGDEGFLIHCDTENVTALELAHELGHHLLLNNGKPPIGTIAHKYTPSDFCTLPKSTYEVRYVDEKEAEYFGLALLLPKALFEEAIESHTIIEIAKQFGTTRFAVDKRGIDLGIWEKRRIQRD